MCVTLRKFIKEDYFNLASLIDDEWAVNHRNIALSMQQTDGNVEQCFLAIDEQKNVGYIYGFVLPNKTLLPEFLYVIPAYRKQGIGRALLAELENKTCCTASMIFYNKSLTGFYSSLGYQVGENLEVAMKLLTATKGESK